VQLQRELAWAVLEPNAEPLWQQVRIEAEELLMGHWRTGELLGARPEEAFFVRCGLGETMTEDDVLRGHLILRVGLAVVAPAEFVEIEIELTVGSRRAGRLPAPERS
jgi:Bacteriophage tail sheath protein